jgi:hypothetical protein
MVSFVLWIALHVVVTLIWKGIRLGVTLNFYYGRLTGVKSIANYDVLNILFHVHVTYATYYAV